MNLHNGVEGEYRIEIRREGKLIKETDWFDNIVLNTGLNRLGTGNAPFTHCRVGTGTSTPNENNLQLDSQIGSTSSWSMASVTNAGAPSYHAFYTLSYTFAQGAVVGNISEIGAGWTAGPSGGLFSRALITDANGNPTTITILAIDQLTVFYRFKMYPSLTDGFGTFFISGELYTYTSRLSSAGSFGQNGNLFNTWQWNYPEAVTYYGADATLGSITGNPSSTSTSSWSRGSSWGSSSNYAYVDNNFYVDSNWWIGIQLGNVTGGIKAFRFTYGLGGALYYQVLLDKPIMKDNTKTLSLNTRLTWGRY